MPNRPTQPQNRRRGVTVQRPGGRSGPVERHVEKRGVAHTDVELCRDCGTPVPFVRLIVNRDRW